MISQVSPLLASTVSTMKTVHAEALGSKGDFTEGFAGKREEAHLHGMPNTKTTPSVHVREACPPQPLPLTAAKRPPLLDSLEGIRRLCYL